MSRTRAGQDVVLILGITPRCGTNFFHKVVTLHPECSGSRFELWEDFLVHASDRLVSYASATQGR